MALRLPAVTSLTAATVPSPPWIGVKPLTAGAGFEGHAGVLAGDGEAIAVAVEADGIRLRQREIGAVQAAPVAARAGRVGARVNAAVRAKIRRPEASKAMARKSRERVEPLPVLPGPVIEAAPLVVTR